MPNYVANKLVIRGSEAHVQRLLDTIRNTEEDKCIDFNKIVPMPKEQKENWYNWSCENWGTKWNVCGDTSLETIIVEDPRTDPLGLPMPKVMIATLTFSTAWATPYPVIQKLSEMFSNVSIAVDYADEDSGYNCGKYGLRSGILIAEWQPINGSKEAMEHYFSLWGQEGWVYNEESGNYQLKEE